MSARRLDPEFARQYLGTGIDRVCSELEEAGGDSRTILYESILDLWEDARNRSGIDRTITDDTAFAALRAARRIAAHVDQALAAIPPDVTPAAEQREDA